MINDKYFMYFAIKQAMKSIQLGGYPFGCCLVDPDKKCVYYAQVSENVNNKLGHAELELFQHMIVNLQSSTLRGYTLYTTSFPCLMCMGAALWMQISRIVYIYDLEHARKYGFNEVIYSMDQILKDKLGKVVVEELKDFKYNDIFSFWKNKNRILYKILCEESEDNV